MSGRGFDRVALKEELQKIWQSGGDGREALREELLDDYLTETNMITGNNLNRMWRGRSAPFGQTYSFYADVEEMLPLNITGYRQWKIMGFADAAYSRKAFNYGTFAFRMRTPAYTDPSWTRVDVGAEALGGTFAGVAAWDFYPDPANSRIRVTITHGGLGTCKVIDVTDLIVANGINPRLQCVWIIKINRGSAEFWVLKYVAGEYPRLIAITQATGKARPFNVRLTAPYALCQTETTPQDTHAALIEFVCSSSAYVGTLVDVELRSWCAIDGDPSPPRTLDAIVATGSGAGSTVGNTWKTTTITAGTLISDGVPVAGYKHKTVYFLAGTAGTLDIQVNYGDRDEGTTAPVWDSITPTPPVVTANQLLSYPTENDACWLRLVYNPAPTYPATVTRARVMMSD